MRTKMLGELIFRYGWVTYLILFFIIFIETGLVVIAFFPGGDGLFSAGLFAIRRLSELAICALHIHRHYKWEHFQYYIGRYLQAPFFPKEKYSLARQLEKAHQYHERYWKFWAVALSRFFPFMRTLVPFAAGLPEWVSGF